MPQTEYAPSVYVVDHTSPPSATGICLRSTDANHLSASFTFEAVRPGLFRTTFTSTNHPLPPRPSVSRPQSRRQVNGKGVSSNDSVHTTAKDIRNGDAVASVDWSGAPVVSVRFSDSQKTLHSDLPFRSYCFDGTGVSHYTKYNRNTLHAGLGEKAAPLNLSNRRFAIDATDCFGYDVYRTDPLYKHIPLLINATSEGCVAIFSSSHSRGSYSIGSEMDGLWGPFKVMRQDHGGLESYLVIGRTLKDIVRSYAELAGFPLLVPRWAFGYIAGGMKYSMLDEPRAAEALMGFADKLLQHDIPCSGFQMSSGYTIAEQEPKTRNVFTWNRHRFPDPKGFIDAYHARGIKLIFNIKPYVMGTHPEYKKLVAAGALFKNPHTKTTAMARLWSAGGGESAEGGHIDMTSAAGFRWWYNGVKELRELGVDCMWNDNNEYVIADDSWQCALDQESVRGQAKELQPLVEHDRIGLWGRALQTELVGKSSHDALVEAMPHERPFVLTRSASAGTMRYCASSWSGDNVTSWEGMKGANAISLTAGLCLLQSYGHDIGGFEGPQPSPELLVRWVQLGIHSPRFAINCFKTSPENNNVGDVIEPWMYPEVIPLIRTAIKRRYELIPYIYSLGLESHLTASPPQRWTGWGYECDAEVWTNKTLTDGETQYWLGDALLVGGVYQPGESSSRLYLPSGGSDDPGYLNTNEPYEYFDAGQWVTVGSAWTASIPILAKVGSALPFGKDVQTSAPGDRTNPANLSADDFRGVEIFPPQANSARRPFSTTWYEDDGISASPGISSFTLTYSASESTIQVHFEQTRSTYEPLWRQLHIVLPFGDSRSVTSSEGRELPSVRGRADGRCMFVLDVIRSI